ncbi:hypothetical protein V8B97DRAFT_315169 [Scleroderma yunnanense]
MYRTPWTTSGSLTSDRIPTRQSSPAPAKQHAKGKGKAVSSTSRAVAELEALLHNAENSSGREKDPKGGCFCQARDHALSTYIPLCYGCGLILCKLNPPYCTCPHCGEVLLGSARRPVLVAQLEEELRRQISKEEEERQRAIEEVQRAEGAFPMLPNTATSRPVIKAAAVSVPRGHKVLSLNSTTKKVTVSSYTTTPVSSRPPSPREDAPKAPHRVPPPPGDISHVNQPSDPARPWKNMEFSDLRYIPLHHEGGPKHPRNKPQKKGRSAVPMPSGSSQQYDQR